MYVYLLAYVIWLLIAYFEFPKKKFMDLYSFYILLSVSIILRWVIGCDLQTAGIHQRYISMVVTL